MKGVIFFGLKAAEVCGTILKRQVDYPRGPPVDLRNSFAEPVPLVAYRVDPKSSLSCCRQDHLDKRNMRLADDPELRLSDAEMEQICVREDGTYNKRDFILRLHMQAI